MNDATKPALTKQRSHYIGHGCEYLKYSLYKTMWTPIFTIFYLSKNAYRMERTMPVHQIPTQPVLALPKQDLQSLPFYARTTFSLSIVNESDSRTPEFLCSTLRTTKQCKSLQLIFAYLRIEGQSVTS